MVTITTSASGTFVGVAVRHNTTQSIPNAVVSAVAYNTERFDTDAFHDVSTNNSRLTVPAGNAGKYLVVSSIQFASNPTGVRTVHLRLNGSTLVHGQSFPAASTAQTVTVSAVVDLSAGDYMETVAYQTSGGVLTLNASERTSPEFQMVRMGA